MFCDKFSWNWSSCPGEDLYVLSMHIPYYDMFFHWNRPQGRVLICAYIYTWIPVTHLKPNLVEIGPTGQTDGQITDNWRSEKLNRAFNSGELKTELSTIKTHALHAAGHFWPMSRKGTLLMWHTCQDTGSQFLWFHPENKEYRGLLPSWMTMGRKEFLYKSKTIASYMLYSCCVMLCSLSFDVCHQCTYSRVDTCIGCDFLKGSIEGSV